MKFHDLRGTPILSVEVAQQLGTVDDVFMRLSDQLVLALRVKTGGVFGGHKALLLQDVKSIGRDAVTVDDVGKLSDEDAVPSLKDAANRDAVEGARVISEGGTEVGTVSDIDADFSSGAIHGYVLGSKLLDRLQHREHLVPAATVRSIGQKTIVVSESGVPDQPGSDAGP